MSIEIDWLRKWTRYAPSSVAFKDADTGVEYTYAALHYLSCRLASHLATQWEIKRGQRVAAIATNEMEYLPLFFAIQKLGAILVPINFRLTGREITHVLSDSSPELLVFQKQFQPVLETVDARSVPEKRWAFDGDSSLSSFLAAELKAFVETGLDSQARQINSDWFFEMRGEFEDPCMILYTSGTTGTPKGAVITNQMMHWNSINTGLRLNLQQSDVNLSFLPFFHTSGWNVLLTPFVHRGARTILMRKFEAERVLKLCESEKITVLFGVPTTMEMMSHIPLFETVDLSSVRYAVVGGEPMSLDLIRTWQNKGVPVRQGYGLTEFGPSVFSLNEEDALRKMGSIGFPNFYIETRVIDQDGRDVKAGEIGELLLRGPVCMQGYWRNEAATTATIQDGWLLTGDLVRFDDEGYFYVVGRKKDMFISGGENVYPVEIEQFLSTHPAIREVAVVSVADAKWGEVGKAYVSLNDGHSIAAEELIAFCQGRLAKYKIPKHVAFLDALPKGDSGKILKRKLKELDAGVSN